MKWLWDRNGKDDDGRLWALDHVQVDGRNALQVFQAHYKNEWFDGMDIGSLHIQRYAFTIYSYITFIGDELARASPER